MVLRFDSVGVEQDGLDELRRTTDYLRAAQIGWGAEDLQKADPRLGNPVVGHAGRNQVAVLLH